MRTSTIIKLAVWLILFVTILNIGLVMMSTSNTVENIIGFFIIIFLSIISIKTKCLTTIKFKKKHEK
nr:MAG TPA: hypothetical protein [Caudoviricetes sp.]